MDAIESKKILKEDAVPTGFDGQVDEFVGGTAAAKVAAWLAHIKKLRAQGFSQAAADAEKSLAQVHPDYRMIAKQSQTAPMPEFRGSIAKALMQDMGVEERITLPNPNSSQSQQLSGADPARVQYDKFKADDARTAAVKQIKDMLKPNGQGVERLQTAIDPATGIIYWGEEQGEGGMVNPRQTPFDWVKQGQYKDLEAILKAAGLNIIPINQKGLFGTTQIAAVDPKGLATLDQQPTPAPQPAPTPTPAEVPGSADEEGAAPNPAPTPTPSEVPGSTDVPNPAPNPAPTPGPIAQSKVDPAKIRRFQELLDKVKAGQSGTNSNQNISGRDGATGQALARLGVTKQQRLDQAFVDKILGPGKRAGSAEANLALLAHFQKQGSAPAVGQGSNPTPPGKPLPSPDKPLSGDSVPNFGNISDNPMAENISKDDYLLKLIRML